MIEKRTPSLEVDYDEVVEVVRPVTKKEMLDALDLANISPRDLLIYFADRFKEVHGYEYPVEWEKEMAVMKAFIGRSKANAGPMVAVLFDEFKGVINGNEMTVTAFSKGSKWIQDLLYIKVQQAKLKAEKKTSSEGLLGTDEFLRKFSL